MKGCYINGISNISAQPTTVSTTFLEEIVGHKEVIIRAFDPDYKTFIKPAAMRRMSKSVKMGVVASKMALEAADIVMPDAIITGTGMGCRQDSERFLENVLHNDEQFLTPTLFIQSTHNTVGGQIALGLGCKGYNVTYVQGAVSFETSVIDAQLLLTESPEQHILVGAIDEIAKNSTKLDILNGQLKQGECDWLTILSSGTSGTICSEGATFMVLGAEQSNKSLAQIKAVTTINDATLDESKTAIETFIAAQGIVPDDIDAVIFGNNGDQDFDDYFHNLQTSIFKNTEQLCYKHLIGEYHTASAFAFWIGCEVFKHNTIPEVLKVNEVKAKQYNKILLYNQYRSRNHSIVLLERC